MRLVERRTGDQSRWLVRCGCGNEAVKIQSSIKRVMRFAGELLCMPCVHKRTSKQRTIHGHAVSAKCKASETYYSWESMIARCTKVSHKSYAAYGGRGITVCPAWRDFKVFLRDMGDRPPGTTLGRIENEKGYQPGNCRWETMKEQQRNRRSNRLLVLDGVSKPAIEWAELMNIPPTAMYRRLVQGWSDKDAILRPVKNDYRRPIQELVAA